MIQISREDLLLALKRFKGIAKQDLLPHNLDPHSDYWKTHAEARRETYAKLIELVEGEGIEKACVFAYSEYQNLPVISSSNDNPAVKGHLQALEMFFNVVGIAIDMIRKMIEEHKELSQLIHFTPQFQEDYSSSNLVV